MIRRDAGIPEVYRGLIVGKGGHKLQKFQAEFDVTIQVPGDQKEGEVMVEGGEEGVEACIEKMRSVIEHHSRGVQRMDSKSKGKGGKGGEGRKSEAKSQAARATCLLCNAEVAGLVTAVEHLQGQKHRMKVVKQRPDFAEIFQRQRFDLADLEEMLLEPEIAEFHRELNFKVDEILSAIPEMQLRAEKMEEVNAEIAIFSKDPKWLEIKSRVVVHWDDRPEGCKIQRLTRAPDLGEMLTRCSFKEPPKAKIPALPAPLPQVKDVSRSRNSLKAAHKYPAAPGSCRLGIAMMKMLGINFSDYDFICGTSFIKALAGDASRITDAFYIQRFRQTACVLHVPSAYHSQNDAGRAVEMLLRGDSLPGQRCSWKIHGSKTLPCTIVEASDIYIYIYIYIYLYIYILSDCVCLLDLTRLYLCCILTAYRIWSKQCRHAELFQPMASGFFAAGTTVTIDGYSFFVVSEAGLLHARCKDLQGEADVGLQCRYIMQHTRSWCHLKNIFRHNSCLKITSYIIVSESYHIFILVWGCLGC